MPGGLLTEFFAYLSGSDGLKRLGLAPNSHQSGLTNKKKKIKLHTSAGQIFRISAQTLVLSKYNALGAFYRRLQAKKGKLTAMKATARKLAVIYYNVMTKGVEYGINNYEQKIKEQRFKSLQRQAKNYGYVLTPKLE